MAGATAGAKVSLLSLLAATLMASAGLRDAQAAESSRLSYVRAAGAEQCPDETALRLAVAVRLGYDPFVAWAKTTIFAQIARDGTKLRARVYLADESGKAHGSRELVGAPEDCSKLVAAMSLAISIAIDPMSASPPIKPALKETTAPDSESSPDAPAPSTNPSSAPMSPPRRASTVRASPETAAVAEATSPASNKSPWQWHAGLAALVSTGFAPDFATGGAVFTQFDVGAASLGLEGRYDLPASANAVTNRGRVESSLWLATLVPCWRLRPFSLCGLASLGRLHGSGSGVSVPLEQTTTYVGVGGRATFEFPIADRLSLRAHADLVGNLTRVTLAIEQENVWPAPALAAAVGLGAVTRLW